MQPKVVGRDDGPIGLPFKQVMADIRNRVNQRKEVGLGDSDTAAVTATAEEDPDEHEDVQMQAPASMGEMDEGEGHQLMTPDASEAGQSDSDQQDDGRMELLRTSGYDLPKQKWGAETARLPEVRRSNRRAGGLHGSQQVQPRKARGPKAAKLSESGPVSNSATVMSKTVGAILESPDHSNAVNLSGAMPWHVHVNSH